MTIFLQSAAAIALLLICSVGPGLFFIRYLRWRPMETLCGSVALSFLLLYFATLAIYALELSPPWAYATSALAAVATMVCAGDFRRLWRHRETRAAMLAFLAIFFWLILLLLLVRNFSGARWWGDWFEHYERSLFFVEHKPADTKFLGSLGYALPARPPMMNLLTALFFWQVSSSFEIYQVIFAYLNVLSILPCALIAPVLVAKTRNRAWLIAGFLALSPMFVENAIYTWTKEFAAFYVVSALALYLSAWRRGDLGRMVAAVACLSTALLIHYSAAVMVLFLAAHYMVFLFRKRPHKWREFFVLTVVSIAIFMTWLGWSLSTYGAKVTFGSNTAVTSSQHFSFTGNLQKIAENLFNTIVPFPLRGSYQHDPAYNPRLPPQGLAYCRDWCFAIYQTEFPAMLGWGGLILVVWQLASLWRRPPSDSRNHRYAFWLALVAIVTPLSIVVHGEYDYLGVAHICLQPMVLLGLTFAAVGLPHVPKPVRAVALAGLLVDAVFGTLLNVYVLNNDFGWLIEGNRVRPTAHFEMGMIAIGNGFLKISNQFSLLGDHAIAAAAAIEVCIAAGTVAICVGLWFLAAGSAGRIHTGAAKDQRKFPADAASRGR